VLSYPSAMTVSARVRTTVTDLLRRHRTVRATRWRKLPAGRQALLGVAYLRKGETHTDLAGGFGIGTSTVYRHLREAIALLAAMAPTLAQAIEVAAGRALMILDGTRQRGPGERVNAELKNWRILHKIRSCPTRAADLVAAVQTLLIAST